MKTDRTALFLYLALMGIYAVGMKFPNDRVWGINLLAFIPEMWRYTILGFGLIIGVAAYLLNIKRPTNTDENAQLDGRQLFTIVASSMIVLSAFIFWFFRAKTHFLGDGYQALGGLAAPEPVYKFTELGEILIHVALKELTGPGMPGALLSFQILSVLSGLIAIIVTALFAVRYTEETSERTFILLGVISGGYSLLFFGYVEHYSVFVLSVLAFALTGLLVADRKAPRWIVLPLFLISVSMHLMGATLLPAVLYLYLRHTKIGNMVGRFGAGRIWIMAFAIAAIVYGSFLGLYSSHSFLRFAFIPVISHQFTIDSYTLFSISHLVDLLNLLVLLCPGLVIALFFLFRYREWSLFRYPKFSFLLVLIVSTLTAPFIFDPKLGMARDWDLFSFAGVSVVLTSILVLLELKKKHANLSLAMTLFVMVGLLALVPRVAAQNSHDAAINQILGYFAVDVHRSGNNIDVVEEYCKNLNDSANVARIQTIWETNYPEKQINLQGSKLLDAKKISEAMTMFNHAIAINPGFAAAYYNRGLGYIELRQFQRALEDFEIANGLNPNNPSMIANLGYAHLPLGHTDEAIEFSSRALELDPEMLLPMMTLLTVYKATGNQQLYAEYLTTAANHVDAPAALLLESATFQCSRQRFSLASKALQRALSKGLNADRVSQLIGRYPALAEHINDRR